MLAIETPPGELHPRAGILVVTNLYPRPDQPTRGMFNLQTVRELSRECDVAVRVVVPEWRMWRWPAIRGWSSPHDSRDVEYWPAFYLPGLGRSLAHQTYRWSIASALSAALRHGTGVLVPWLYPDGSSVTLCAGRGSRVWMMALGSDTFHLRSRWRRRAILKAAQAADGIICVCGAVANRLVAAGVEPRKVHVVPNGVDAARFHFRPASEALVELHELDPGATLRAKTIHASGGRIILMVGNLVSVKGMDVAISAFAALFSDYVKRGGVSLFIIGSGSQRRSLGHLARRLGVAESVVFLGNRLHDEVALWMNVADVLCLPSRSEGMPNVVLEAVVSGLPVAATRVGACPEILTGDGAARLCEPGSATGMADALRELLDMPDGRLELASRHARRYSWRLQARTILELMNGRQKGTDKR